MGRALASQDETKSEASDAPVPARLSVGNSRHVVTEVARPELAGAKMDSGRPRRSLRSQSVVYRTGDVINGKYRLESLIGEGGMGTVWRAHNLTLGAEVAIKLINSAAASSEAADRLLREAQAAARLLDPAIVRVFDFGKTAHGDPFIVMELLEGENLETAIVRRGRLSPTRAASVVLPVTRALTLAHSQGIVHRDLKPENVFLAKAPCGLQPKVVDFGVAKFDEAPLRLTTTGTLLGSPLYMSPEQARGQAADHKADIWAIATVLYQTITGRTPFDGDNYNAVMFAIMSKPHPSLASFGVDDERLSAIIDRGLAKQPDERFESMQAFGKELAQWLIDQGVDRDVTGASLEVQWLRKNSQIDQLVTMRPPEGFEEAPVTGAVLLLPAETATLVRRVSPVRKVFGRTREAVLGKSLGVRVGLGVAVVGVAFVVGFVLTSLLRVQDAPVRADTSERRDEVTASTESRKHTAQSEADNNDADSTAANGMAKAPDDALETEAVKDSSESAAAPEQAPTERRPVRFRAAGSEAAARKSMLKNPFE